MVLPEGFDAAACAARRSRLSALLQGRPALLASGEALPRNYAANAYPYRPASHFLYLVGLPLPGSFLLHEEGRWTLFAPAPSADDALWHGHTPSLGELAEHAGLTTRPVEELPARLAALRGASSAPVATLPTPDVAACLPLEALLGRTVRPGVVEGADAVLADALISLRLVHDAAAVAEMRRAAAATAAGYDAGMRVTRPGLTEWEVRAAMEAEFIRRGMPCAYNPIVTVHGEVLHNHAHHHRLSAGDLLLADVGAESQGGWASDVTRTWPVSGRFSATQADFYDVVLRAQAAAIEAVRPGASYRQVHLTAARELARGLVGLGVLEGDVEELVADGVVALLFPHGVGHLLGLDVHDMEDLGDRAGYAPGRRRSPQFGLRYLRLDRELVPGMAVTIEPGLYVVPAILESRELTEAAGDRLNRRRLAQFSDVRGIRIEDDVLVTEGGREVLTDAIPKARAQVEARVGQRE